MLKENTQHSSESKLFYIDNLRGIAILMVIITHADVNIKGLHQHVQTFADYCQMGVQLFFIISAYTLCISMDRRKDSDENLKAFYLRRYFRIAPLYYVGILLYLIYFSIINPLILGKAPAWAPEYTFKTILSNIFLINDFVPGNANNGIVPGGWSIGTETTFYAIFPFIYLLYHKYRTNNLVMILIPVLGFLLCFSFFKTLKFLANDIIGYDNFNRFEGNNSFLYFSLLCQLPVFLLGMTLYFNSLKFRKATAWDQFSLLLSFIGFSAIAIIVYKSHKSFISLLPLAPAISFFFLFLLFKEISFLNNKVMARIGQLSFSIYIFHFVFAWEGSRFLYNYLGHILLPEVLFIINIALTIFLSVLVAFFSEKLIEKKGIELGKKLINLSKRRTTKVGYNVIKPENS